MLHRVCPARIDLVSVPELRQRIRDWVKEKLGK